MSAAYDTDMGDYLQGIGISSISSAHDPNATTKVSKSASSPLVRQCIQVSVRNAPNCIFCAFSFFGAVVALISRYTRENALCALWLQGHTHDCGSSLDTRFECLLSLAAGLQ